MDRDVALMRRIHYLPGARIPAVAQTMPDAGFAVSAVTPQLALSQ